MFVWAAGLARVGFGGPVGILICRTYSNAHGNEYPQGI